MNLLEKQLLVVRKLRESMPFQERSYFYLSPMLNTKVHKKTEKLVCKTSYREKISERQRKG